MSMHINNAALPRCICLAGPTASGKTAAALGIAAHLKGKILVEIISVDSALVYKGLDIGTAKPSAAELAAVPHHLIDIRDPLQPYSAAEFAHDATRLMSEITARGHLPLLVGGTMLYFKALFEGLDDMPKADVAIRAELAREAAQLGWPVMHQKLAAIDPITAARLQPNDAQRIQRALEVYRISGKPLSTFQNKNNAKNAINNIANYLINTLATDELFNKNVLFISLEPQNRAWLHERIALRFDAMLASGFEAEVRSLRARGDLHVDTPSVRCVGYRQMWEALDTLEDASKDGILDKKSASKIMDELREKGIAATRQLCKRQLTWLRGMPQRQVVACDEQDALEQVLTLVDAWLPSIAP